MDANTKENVQDVASPPLPPAAVFDQQHLAEAKPVQPLRGRQAANGFQRIVGRRLTGVATMVAGVLICVGIGAASVDWEPGLLSAKDEPAQSAVEAQAPSNAAPSSSGPVVRRPDQKRRVLSNPRGREVPSSEMNEAEDDQKPRARMVSVIH